MNGTSVDNGSASPLTNDTRMLVSGDGTPIYANAVGDPSKQAIVFIHGFAWSMMAFDSIFGDSEWTDRLYLVRYDVRGHGRSGKPDTDEAWESKRFAEDFDAVVEAFKLQRPFVAGWSLGASHLIDILSFHSIDHVAGIVNIAGATFLTEHMLQDLATPAIGEQLDKLMRSPDVGDFQAAAACFIDMCCPNLPYEYRQMCLGNIMMQPRSAMIRSFGRQQREETFDKVGQLGVYCLVIYGSEDKAVLTDVLPRVYGKWKNVTVEVVEGGTHVPWSEVTGHARVFREKMLGWIERVMNS